MPIDWTTIPVMPLGLLAALTFVASLIGNSLSRSAFIGSILTVIIFAAFTSSETITTRRCRRWW